ncbi:hypothetical protein EOA32_06905 [Mesorhizobium sp. M1A.F.Ca.ET.072.01.1.1]|nr:hypothetical protein EOA32_06905 [Mesorhizobium sp. M1A.F.Ca.ET.072.01.1.1]TIV04071.1 MAG: hypothetical protein E5W04_05320 [Mesorhizobium sp.]
MPAPRQPAFPGTDLGFVARCEVVHLLGPPGTGKSIALAVKGRKERLFLHARRTHHRAGKGRTRRPPAGTHPLLLPACSLVVDEIGYLPVVHGGGNLFFQPVNARYEKGAIILTSNRGFAEWGEVFGEPNLS